jgi:NADPH:quinone reductase-like Zn-dependent oxidoreductase
LTDGKGVHAVYDGVGKDTFDEDFEVVRSRGTLVMYGNASVCPPFQMIPGAEYKLMDREHPPSSPYYAYLQKVLKSPDQP